MHLKRYLAAESHRAASWNVLDRIKHAKKINPLLNAFVSFEEDVSYIEGRVDQLQKEPGALCLSPLQSLYLFILLCVGPKPFHGMPIAVKDIFCTKRLPSTCASAVLKGTVVLPRLALAI